MEIIAEEKPSNRTISEQQLTLYFQIGAGTPPPEDETDEAADAIHDKAFELVRDKVSALPNWERRCSFHNGEPTDSLENSYMHPRAELCGNDAPAETFDGKLAFSIAFHSEGPFPLDLATALKHFCLEQYQEAAGLTSVTFVKARTFTRYTETDSADWPEV